MTDADELLRRIEKARHWAKRQGDQEQMQSDSGGARGSAHLQFAAIYVVICAVLDQILDPLDD